jgi:hypothetical protein
MTALKVTAAAFFTHWFIVYLATFVMTAFFRMVGAAFPNFDAASKVSGFSITAMVLYIGYQVRTSPRCTLLTKDGRLLRSELTSPLP